MNERDEVERQLRAIADHAVGMSRAATVTGEVRATRRARRRPLVAIGALATAAAVVAAVAVVANRGDDGTDIVAGASTTRPATGPTEFGGNITVLESPQHGPQLCTAVEDSLPPQCGGPDVVGWDWGAVDTEESANGTTWGGFYVVGTWVDGVFTMTRPATEPVPMPNDRDIDFTTPCEELRTDDPDAIVTIEGPLAEESADDFAGSWWDAQHGVYNVAFTGDIEAHEAALREEYDGRICVVQHEHTEAELRAAQDLLTTISSRPLGVEITGTGVDTPGNRVSVDVLVADAATEAFVAQHLAGVEYSLHAALVPVESSTTGVPQPTTPPTDPPRYPNQEIDSAAAALDTWLASGIDDYSFHIRIQTRFLAEGTFVVEGGVVSAGEWTIPDRGGTDRYETIPALLAELLRAERDATGKVEVAWGEYGIPLKASVDWHASGEDDTVSWTISEFRLIDGQSDMANAEAALAAWNLAGVNDYSFIFERHSPTGSTPGPVRVEVREGVISTTQSERPVTIDAVPTIPELIDEVASAEREAAVVVVEWGAHGVPVDVNINPSTTVDGEEVTWSVAQFAIDNIARSDTLWEEADEASKRWTQSKIPNYSFHWRSGPCNAIPFDMIVTVRDGRVVNAEGGVILGVITIPEMIDHVATAATGEVEWDERGIPVEASLNENDPDECSSWTITEFTPLG